MHCSIPDFVIGWGPFLLLIPAIWSFALLTIGVSRLHQVGYLRTLFLLVVSVLLTTFFLVTVILAGIIS